MLQKLTNPLEHCELKTDDTDGSLTGYASVFNGNDSDGDTILPGAFKSTLRSRGKPLMLYSHNPYDVIGKWVTLEEDDKGLKVKGELTPGHTVAQNVYASLKHKAMNGLSIGFRIPPNGATPKDADNPFGGREIKKIDLVEISVVSMPADKAARIGNVKEIDEDEVAEIKTIKDAEFYLREAGFSRSAARAFVARVAASSRSESVDALQTELVMLKRQIAAQGHTAAIRDIIHNL